MLTSYIFFIFAAISSLAMGLFYIMDVFFRSRGVYIRPSQAMIVSSIVPLLSVPLFVMTPWWDNPTLLVWLGALISGVFLIWGNWFYFIVMFPKSRVTNGNEVVENATELALYEGAKPAVVLILSLIVSQFIVYTDTISAWQGFSMILIVLGIILFGMADGYTSFSNWSYRIKLIAFALLVSVSQLVQDLTVGYIQNNLGYTLIEAYFTVSPIVWIGMFSGIIIVLWKQEWHHFKVQWTEKIKKYSGLILFAELIAVLSYAALIASYTGEHVAVSGAIAASFPVIVFFGGLMLQRLNVQTGLELVTTTSITKKFLFILITLLGVIGVVLL